MSENRNDNDEFEKKFNDMLNGFTRKVNDVTKDVMSRLSDEKEKAQVRSEIGHHSRDLSRAYEKLGRQYYESVTSGKEMDVKDTMELIHSKELLVKLLNEKLESLEKSDNEE